MLNHYIETFIMGFSLHIGLLLGAVYQNSFIVLRGLSKKPVFTIAATFTVSGIVAATMGIYAMHYITGDNEVIKKIIGFAGSVFLLYIAFKNYIEAKNSHQNGTQEKYTGILAALAMVWMTPHVYADMFAISSISMLRPEYLYPMIIAGFTSAAFVWFFGLAIFSKKIATIYKSQKTQVFLQYASALVLVLSSINIFIQTFFEHAHHHTH